MIYSSLIICCILSTVYGIFEEQLGEYDWKNEKFGQIKFSIHNKLDTFIATSDNILACLELNGSIKWRVSFPQSTIFQKLLVVDENVVTFTTTHGESVNGTNSNAALVRGWSLNSGVLDWDYSLGSWTAESETEVVYNLGKKVLTVLASNTLHFVQFTKENFKKEVKSWSWTPTSSGLALSSLVVPTVASEKSAETRIATACIRSDANPCESTAVLTVNFEDRTVSSEQFAGLPGGKVGAVVASDGVEALRSDDMLFSVQADEARGGLLMHVLFLATNSVETLVAPGGVSVGAAVTSVESFVWTSAAGEIAPALSWCRSDGRTDTCEAFSLRGTGSDGAWSLAALTSCAGQAGAGRPFFVSSAVPHLPGVARSLHCVAPSWDTSRTVLRKVDLFSASAAPVTLTLDLTLPVGSEGVSPLQHVSVTRSNDATRALLVLSSGLTLEVDVNAAGQRVVWSSDQGLARMQQAVLLQVEKPVAAAATDSAGNHKIPTLSERLRLQKDDLIVSVPLVRIL